MYLSKESTERLARFLDGMDENTCAEMDLVRRMIEENESKGILQRVWYDPEEKVTWAEYVRWERTEEKKKMEDQ